LVAAACRLVFKAFGESLADRLYGPVLDGCAKQDCPIAPFRGATG